MPTTRSATLRVAHARACPNHSRTALDSVGTDAGCRCKPAYYTLHRDATGRPVKSARVRDRKVAERALRKLLVAIDEGRVGVGNGQKGSYTFRAWSAQYLHDLETVRKDKGSTVRAYGPTIRYADPIFGALPLEDIGTAEINRFVKAIREAKASDATLAKHLRHLGAILRAAEPDHLARSPLTRKYVRELRLRVPKGDEPYTDVELAKLWAKMEALEYEDVYMLTCKLAVATGLRQGELIALEWQDVNLSARTLRVRHHFDMIDGLVAPKDRDERVVNLIPAAVALLEAHVATVGVRPDSEPVLRAPRSGERINGQYLTRLVKQAAKKAGIPEVGEGGRRRRPFHAFRATFTRILLEAGRDPQFVQAQLGHAGIELTIGTYGRRTDAFNAEQAAAVETFPV